MARYTVAITGTSGSAYGVRLLDALLRAGHDVAFVATPVGRQVVARELGLDLPEQDGEERILSFLELPPTAALRVVAFDDLFDSIASGSHAVDGMVVAPASMGFCGSLAAGLGSKVAERAADVMLKEKRPLVLVPRETPLGLIHLRNLTTLAEAGAVILPAMPAFYQHPKTLDDVVDFVVGKVLDVLGIENHLFERWGE